MEKQPIIEIIKDNNFSVAIFKVGKTLHVTVIELCGPPKFLDSMGRITTHGEIILQMLTDKIDKGEYPNLYTPVPMKPSDIAFSYRKVIESDCQPTSYIIIVT